MYQFILFDLDGTITNSEPGILASVRYALGKLGAAEPDYPTLRKFIGPPLRDSFRDYCGLSPERAEIGGGFVLRGKTSDKDLSYGALLAADREEHQAEIAAELFKDNG